jgi:hypothetical protein
MSRDHIEHVALCIEVLVGLGRRDVPDGAKQALFVESIDLFEGFHLDFVDAAPRFPPTNVLGFVEAIDGLGQSIVLGVADVAN